jgi:hypothetical protein
MTTGGHRNDYKTESITGRKNKRNSAVLQKTLMVYACNARTDVFCRSEHDKKLSETKTIRYQETEQM